MAEELKAGDKLGDFEIVEVAGAGGMGVVYKARQQSLDRDVALKVIKDEIAAEPEYRERFLREAKLAASVDHPHVVTVYDVGDEDGPDEPAQAGECVEQDPVGERPGEGVFDLGAGGPVVRQWPAEPVPEPVRHARD